MIIFPGSALLGEGNEMIVQKGGSHVNSKIEVAHISHYLEVTV